MVKQHDSSGMLSNLSGLDERASRFSFCNTTCPTIWADNDGFYVVGDLVATHETCGGQIHLKGGDLGVSESEGVVQIPFTVLIEAIAALDLKLMAEPTFGDEDQQFTREKIEARNELYYKMAEAFAKQERQMLELQQVA